MRTIIDGKRLFLLALICMCTTLLGCGSNDKGSTEMPIEFSDQKESSEIETIDELVAMEAGLDNTTSEKSNRLEEEIEKKTEVTIENGYNQDTGTVTCKINAPDIYSYFQEHEEELMAIEEEQLLNKILLDMEDNNFPIREVSIELPAKVTDGKIIVDTSTYEYQDAVVGGLYSYLTELYEKALD